MLRTAAMRISRGPIFLPRYSGVRPTIKPAMNTVSKNEAEHAVQAAPNAAEDHFAKRHEDDGHHAADRRVTVVHGIDRAIRCGRREGRPQRRVRHAKARLLAFHVAARLALHAHVHLAVGCKLRRARLFEHGDDHQPDHQEDEHDGEYGSSLPTVGHETPEAEDAGHRNDQERQALHQVRKRRGILKRTGRVHAVVAAAVRAQLLDGHLAGLRAHGHDGLVNHLDRGRVVGVNDVAFLVHAHRLQQLHFLILAQVLRRTLPHVDHGHHQRPGGSTRTAWPA